MGQLGFLFPWVYNPNRNMLTRVHTYIGCSVGAVIGTLLSIGYTPQEVFDIALFTTILKSWKAWLKLQRILGKTASAPKKN